MNILQLTRFVKIFERVVIETYDFLLQKIRPNRTGGTSGSDSDDVEAATGDQVREKNH